MFNFNFFQRLKNKTFVLTFATTVIAFVYQLSSLFGVVPTISQDDVVQFVGIVVTLLASIGILVDPTTDGVSDSQLVMDKGKKKTAGN